MILDAIQEDSENTIGKHVRNDSTATYDIVMPKFVQGQVGQFITHETRDKNINLGYKEKISILKNSESIPVRESKASLQRKKESRKKIKSVSLNLKDES